MTDDLPLRQKSSNTPLAHWEDLVFLAGTARKEKRALILVGAESIKREVRRHASRTDSR